MILKTPKPQFLYVISLFLKFYVFKKLINIDKKQNINPLFLKKIIFRVGYFLFRLLYLIIIYQNEKQKQKICIAYPLIGVIVYYKNVS